MARDTGADAHLEGHVARRDQLTGDIIDARPRVSDDDWVALGCIDDDADYRNAFQRLFSVDITPPPS